MAGRKHRHMENRILRDYFGTVRHLQETQSVGRSCDGYTATHAIELGTHDIPKWASQELQQAIDHSRGLIPISVIHEKGTPYDDSIVMMRLADYVRYHTIPPVVNDEEVLSSRDNTSEERTTSGLGDIHAQSLYGFVLCTCGEKLTTFHEAKAHQRSCTNGE